MSVAVDANGQGHAQGAASPSPDLEPALVWRGGGADAAQRLRVHVYRALSEQARL